MELGIFGLVFAFALPLIASRLFFHREWTSIACVTQDLFVASQPLLVLWFFQTFVGTGWGIGGVGTLYLGIYLISAIDVLTYRETALRVDGSILYMIKDLALFWDSAKVRGLFRFVLAGGGIALYVTSLLSLFHAQVDSVSRSPDVVFLTLVLGLVSAMVTLFMSKEARYRSESALFRLERMAFFRKHRRKRSLAHIKPLGGHGERKRYLDKRAPLLKYTRAFDGPKQFSLRCEKGERPHVIFLFLESFRAHDVSKRGITPRFDALAKEGVLFKNFYANGLPSFQAVVPSLFGIPSVMDEKSALLKGEMPLISLADVLKQGGYESTYGVGGPLQFDNQRKFYTHYGFDHVFGRGEVLSAFPEADMTSWGVHDETFVRYVVDLLEQKRSSPQFLSLFTLSNHEPWVVPESFVKPELPDEISAVHRRFLTTMHYTDHCLGLFVDLLKERGLSKDVILFAMGDHGFPMGEHGGNFILQRNLYEENVRVPLLIYADGRIAEPKELECVASQTDLMATVMDLLHLKGVNHSVGNSLVRQCSEREAFMHNPYVYQYSALRKGAKKVIQTKMTKRFEVYNVEDDPGELHNLKGSGGARIRRLKWYHDLFTTLSQQRAFTLPKDGLEEEVLLDLSGELRLSAADLEAKASSHKALCELNLSNCSTLTERGLSPFLTHCPHLASLNLSHCVALSDEALSLVLHEESPVEELNLEGVPISCGAFKGGSKRLRQLRLKGGVELDDASAERLVELFPNVQEATLSCGSLSARGLALLLERWKLKFLVIDGGEHIEAEALEGAFQRARGIEGLSLDGFNLDDSHLTLFKGLAIQTLYLDYTHDLTDAGLKYLYQAPIKHLNLGYPQGVTLEGARALREALPFLRTLYFQGLPLCLNSQMFD